MLRVFANKLSPPCHKVRLVCEHLGIDYEWVEKDFASGELRRPEYLAFHPAGKVPAIDDDGFVLFESEAIIRYLAAREESPLYPQPLRARAVVEQWSAFSTQHVGLAMTKVVFNRVVGPKFGIEVDERSIEEGLKWLGRYLPIIDERLEISSHLAGDDITIADISLLSILDTAARADVDLAPYEHIVRWQESLHDKPFWKRTHGAG